MTILTSLIILRAIAYAHLSRWPVALLAALVGMVEVYSLNCHVSFLRLLLTGTVLGATYAAACAINDVWDVHKDYINHPERPLPSGQLSPQQGRRFAGVLFGIAAIAAVCLGWKPASLVLFMIPCLWFYSQILKISGILGNFVVASIIASLFILAGLVVHHPFAATYPALFMFIYQLAKEIIWDIQDAQGDRAAGLITLATRWGPRIAYRVAWILLLVNLLSIPLALSYLPMAHPIWFGAFTTVMLGSFMGALWRYQQATDAEQDVACQFTAWERWGLVSGIMGLLGG